MDIAWGRIEKVFRGTREWQNLQVTIGSCDREETGTRLKGFFKEKKAKVAELEIIPRPWNEYERLRRNRYAEWHLNYSFMV